MKDFTITWKELAQSRLPAYRFVQRCILRAMGAKTPQTLDERKTLLAIFIEEQFKPITAKRHLMAHGMQPWYGLQVALPSARLTENADALLACLETEEHALYRALYDDLCQNHGFLEPPRYYAYVFVREDLSAAQAAVQATHVGIKLGHQHPCDPDSLYLVLIALPPAQVEELRALCARHRVTLVEYREADLASQITALATAPISANRRQFLREYKML